MPFVKLTTNYNFSSQEKQNISSKITDLIVQKWNVLPDKIQVQVSKVEIDEISRAGVVPSNTQFKRMSRAVSLDYKEVYSTEVTEKIESLVAISIDTWTGFSFADKTNLVVEITKYLTEKFEFSGDNIVVYIRDVLPENWFQNGISGRNPDFLSKSRNAK